MVTPGTIGKPSRGAIPARGVVLCFLAAALATPALKAQEAEGCRKCHEPAEAVEAGTVHPRAGIGCVDCHGGNAKAETASLAHGGSFLGKIPRTEIPNLCARCHSDVRRMNPYGLPTDQLSQYLLSGHGKALAGGDVEVATCVDCHHAHGIRKVHDPQSPVHPKNVPSTCGRCHSNGPLMEKHGRDTSPEAQYRESIHAEMLLERGDLSAPTCVTCHGNHGAMPPGFTDIAHVCGKCHIPQQDFFALSPHAAQVESGVFRGCITCHGNHRILREPARIYKRCGTCHEPGDRALRTRDGIAAITKRLRERFDAVRDRCGSLTRAGFFTEEEAAKLEEAKTALLQIPPAQHALDAVDIRKRAVVAEEILRDIEGSLGGKECFERAKKWVLVPIWAFLIGMAFLFRAKRRSLDPPGGRGDASVDS